MLEPLFPAKSTGSDLFARVRFKRRTNEVNKYQFYSNQDIQSTNRYCGLKRLGKAEQIFIVAIITNVSPEMLNDVAACTTYGGLRPRRVSKK